MEHLKVRSSLTGRGPFALALTSMHSSHFTSKYHAVDIQKDTLYPFC